MTRQMQQWIPKGRSLEAPFRDRKTEFWPARIIFLKFTSSLKRCKNYRVHKCFSDWKSYWWPAWFQSRTIQHHSLGNGHQRSW